MPPPLAAPPLPGFVPPYEVARIVRVAGYEPLTRPRREGSTYVVRATNHRGILMRVVIDARSGAIRAVNRIVPGPGSYGAMGVMPPPYGDPYDPAAGPVPVGPPGAYAVAPYGPAPAPPRYPQAYPPPPYPPAYPPPPYPPAYSEPEEYGMAPGLTPGLAPGMAGPPGRPLEADLNGPPPPPPGYAPHPPKPPRPRSPGLATHEAKPSRTDEKPIDIPAVRPEPAPNTAIAPAPLSPEPPPAALKPVLPPAASAPPPPARRAPQPIQD